jgi:hypothetical protein
VEVGKSERATFTRDIRRLFANGEDPKCARSVQVQEESAVLTNEERHSRAVKENIHLTAPRAFAECTLCARMVSSPRDDIYEAGTIDR